MYPLSWRSLENNIFFCFLTAAREKNFKTLETRVCTREKNNRYKKDYIFFLTLQKSKYPFSSSSIYFFLFFYYLLYILMGAKEIALGQNNTQGKNWSKKNTSHEFFFRYKDLLR